MEEHASALPGWTPWALLAAAAVPLVLVAVEAQRLLLGEGPTFLQDGQDQELSAYTRCTYFLQLVQPERTLVLPLVALAGVTWLLGSGRAWARPGRLRAAALGLTCVLGGLACGLLLVVAYLAAPQVPEDASAGFFAGDRLEALGPAGAGALVLAVLAAALLRLLAVRPPAPADADLADDDLHDDDLDDDDLTEGAGDHGPVRLDVGAAPFAVDEPGVPAGTVPVRLVEDGAPAGGQGSRLEPDALARYRRPGSVPVDALAEPDGSGDVHARYRRP